MKKYISLTILTFFLIQTTTIWATGYNQDDQCRTLNRSAEIGCQALGKKRHMSEKDIKACIKKQNSFYGCKKPEAKKEEPKNNEILDNIQKPETKKEDK